MEKIKEIYQNIMQETDEMKQQRKILEEKIESVLQETKAVTDRMEYEAERDKLFGIAITAEEGGFLLGFHYAVKLIMECGGSKSLQDLNDL